MSPLPLHESAGKADGIQPSSVHAYIDRVRGWAQHPFTRADRAYLQQQCSKLYAPPPRRRRWDRDGYQQYLDLTQPTDTALRHLGAGATVNYTEFALDWVFNYQDERADAATFANQHLVKRWHRASQGIRFVEGVTRYIAGRHATANLVTYADQACKVTGELACVHIEYRVRGQRSLQRLGIRCAQDLVNFGHYEFWKQRLILRAIDEDQFGRLYNRHLLGKGPRYGPWEHRVTGGVTYNYDSRTGYTLVRIYDSTQALLDEFGKRLDMRTCLVDLNVEHLLPERSICRAEAKMILLCGNGLAARESGCHHLS